MNTDDSLCSQDYRSDTARQVYDRREFVRVAAGISAALASAPLNAQVSDGPTTPPGVASLPRITFGRHSISRLICGNNPFGGGSHLSVFVNHQMRSYYTPEQILKTLRRCEEVGINAWQSVPGLLETYRRYIDNGGKMQFMVIESNRPEGLKKLAQGGCLGVAHHGEVTDRLFKNGKLDQVNEYLKHVRDAGLLVGVSTHMPDVVDAIESKGWDVDYYMTCVYERHRTEADLQKLLGHVPLPVGEVYLKSDPLRMFKAIQQTKRLCLAFKILAAGRRTDVEQAFRETFAAIKPTDGVIVGIYDRYSDQAAQNAAFVRRFG